MKRSPNNFQKNQRYFDNQESKRFRNDSGRASTSVDIYSNSFNHLVNANRNADDFARSSKAIFDYYNEYVQSHDCFRRKIELKEALNHMFKHVFPYLGVYIVGSSANGFGTNQSDVDICLVVSHEELDQKSEAIYLLKMIAKAMRKASFIKNLNLISAKVPIIKFYDSHNEIECDLNLNNSIGIRNTHLLRCYSEQDWRVRPLVLSIKRWAKYHNINDASQQTISSYSLTLMTINYLQNICKPPVLPVLQKLFPNKFDIDVNLSDLKLNEDLPVFTSQNTQTLGDLFAGFLDYYSNFDFEHNVISVRTGSVYSKNSLPRDIIENDSYKFSQWKYILIEEPFDLSNTARSVFDQYIYSQILHVIKRSAKRINETKSYDSLFQEKYYVPSSSSYDFGSRQGSHRRFNNQDSSDDF